VKKVVGKWQGSTVQSIDPKLSIFFQYRYHKAEKQGMKLVEGSCRGDLTSEIAAPAKESEIESTVGTTIITRKFEDIENQS